MPFREAYPINDARECSSVRYGSHTFHSLHDLSLESSSDHTDSMEYPAQACTVRFYSSNPKTASWQGIRGFSIFHSLVEIVLRSCSAKSVRLLRTLEMINPRSRVYGTDPGRVENRSSASYFSTENVVAPTEVSPK